jgi:hypothetical protein
MWVYHPNDSHGEFESSRRLPDRKRKRRGRRRDGANEDTGKEGGETKPSF